MKASAKIWVRWAALHGVVRAAMSAEAARGEPLGRIVLGKCGWDERYQLLDRIRAEGPLVHKRFVWASANHEVCRAVLRDKRFGVSDPDTIDLPWPVPAILRWSNPGLPNPVESPAMVAVDPPEHTHYRRLVSQSFTPRAIDKLGAQVVERTAQLLDSFELRPEVDLLTEFATQLPAAIIAEILGLPSEDIPEMIEWGEKGGPLVGLGIRWREFRNAIDGLRQADRVTRAHFDRLRHGDPSDTPFGRLVAEDSLTDRELAANASLLIGAGFETTVNLIGSGIVLLLEHPDQLALLRDNPELWPGAIEEILRFESPVQLSARTAHEDVDLAGQHVKAGDTIALLLGGANRDPHAFADPNRFDITRANAREHLAFGSGIHACLGAALARIEGTTALRMLFERFPQLHLTAPPEPRGMSNLHGYRRLQTNLGHPDPRPMVSCAHAN